MNTLKQEDRDGSAGHKEERVEMEERGERERAIDFNPLKPQFIILRDTLHRLAAVSLFVILVTQKRSSSVPLTAVMKDGDSEVVSRPPHFASGRLCIQSQVSFHSNNNNNNNARLRPCYEPSHWQNLAENSALTPRRSVASHCRVS